MTVPYIFANSTGSIPLAELDGNFANVSNYVVSAGTVVDSVQANILTVGTLTYLDVNGNITNNGNIITPYFYGDGSNISNLTGPNVTGQVGNALVAGTVYTPAQSNITSLGTLTSLSVNGNTTSGNVIVNGLMSATGSIFGLSVFLSQSVSATGNITSGNILTSGVVSATSNITGGNILTSGVVSATSNITGGNILTSGVVSVTGTITGRDLSVASNIAAGNIAVSGAISATGNVVGGNLITSGNVFVTTGIIGGNISTTGNIIGSNITGSNLSAGNIFSAGSASIAGNISSGNLTILGQISSTGSITGGNVLTSGLISVTGNIVSTANITGINLLTTGAVSALGNIKGAYIFGNGALLTGVITSVANINLGSSNVTVTSAGGNVTVGIGGTPNVVQFANTGQYVTGVVSATGNIVGNYLIGNAYYLTGSYMKWTTLANTPPVGAQAGDYWFNSATGIKYQYINDGTGNSWVDQSSPTSFATLTVGSILNNNANGIGNIGTNANYFNTIFAKSTSAQYADLAEMYCADNNYPPGTVVEFGGDEEITVSTTNHSTRVAGIVSTHPSYLMNSTLEGRNTVQVALVGRVPCLVIGTVHKGDRLVTSDIPGVAQAMNRSAYEPGCIVGKSLQDYDSTEVGMIEVAVGRD